MSSSGSAQFPPNIGKTPQIRVARLTEGQGVRIVRIPENLADIREKQVIRGEIIRQNPDGTLRIRTAQGDIDVRLPDPTARLQTGQQVELELKPGTPPLQAELRPAPEQKTQTPGRTTPDTAATQTGQTGSAALRPGAYSAPPDRSATETPQAPALPAPGTLVRLTPLPPGQPVFESVPAPIPEINIVLQKFDFKTKFIADTIETTLLMNPLKIRYHDIVKSQQNNILYFNAPANATPPLIQPPPKDAAATPGPTRTGSPPFFPAIYLSLPPETNLPQAAIAATTLPAAAPHMASPRTAVIFDAAIAAVLPPRNNSEFMKNTAVPAPLSGTARAGSVTLTVTGHTVRNLPVLSLIPENGEQSLAFVLQLPAPGLLPGMRMELMPLAGATVPAVLPQPPWPLTPESSWPALTELLQTLTQIMPPAAQSMTQTVPAPASPAQLGPAALFFLAALRAGDLGGWLGDRALDALRREGKGTILTRFLQEGQTLSRLTADPVAQDWRALPLPLYWQGEVHKAALYYKKDYPEEQEGRKGAGQTRFIFDLQLSRMGKIQLDGLFHAAPAHGRLDLILRTETALSQTMQKDLRTRYAAAMREMDLSGELSFQSAPERWVHIAPGRDLFAAEV